MTRFGVRWGLADGVDDPAALATARDDVVQGWTTAGVVGAIILSPLLTWLLDLPLDFAQAVLLGVVISIVGQFGDLVESVFKRNMGTKDSGETIPGHGGFLDRMDSVLFAGVTVYYFVVWFVQ